MPSSNPALNDAIFQREIQANAKPGSFSPGWGSPASELPPGVFNNQGTTTDQPGQAPPTTGGPIDVGGGDTMRMGGTMSATALLLGLLVVAGWFGWQAVTVTELGVRPDGTLITDISIPPWLFFAAIGAFGLAIVTIFKPKIARFTAPIYSVGQGLFVGGISRAYEVQFSGIVLQAVGLTISVFMIMLVLFATGTIRVTNKMRTTVMVATGAIALTYLVSWIMSMFGSGVPMIHDSGPVGIGFSLLVVGIASFNLLLDFDFTQRGVAAGAPRYMEWFAALGLMITIVWLYLEILRLLSKLRQN